MNILKWDSNLKIRLFGESCFNLLFWMFFPFMAIYFSDTLGKSLTGLLLVFSQVLSVFANLSGGYMVDRFGRKKIMVWATFGQFVSFVIFAAANSPWYQIPSLTFIAFSILGIMGSLYYPASRAMIVDIVPEHQQREVFAVFYTFANINVVLGSLFGAVFFFEYRFPLLMTCVIVTLCLFIIISKYIRETKPDYDGTIKKITWKQSMKEQVSNYKVILNDRVFLMFIIAGILIAQTFTQFDLLIPVMLNETFPNQTLHILNDWNIQLDAKKIFSWLVAENGLLVVILTVFITRITSGANEKAIFRSSFMLYTLAMIIFAFSHSVLGLILSMFVFTMGELTGVSVTDGFVAKLAPSDMRGQYYAAASLRYTIGKTIAPFSIPMASLFSYRTTFLILAGLALLAVFINEYMFNKIEKIHAVKASAISTEQN